MHGLHRLGDASQRQGLASCNGLGRIEHRGRQGGWATTQMTAQQAHDAPFSPSVHPVVDGLLAEPERLVNRLRLVSLSQPTQTRCAGANIPPEMVECQLFQRRGLFGDQGQATFLVGH